MNRQPVYFRIKRNLQPMQYKLTILICNLKPRLSKLQSLLDELYYQIQSKPVQVLWLGDNKSITTGEKRNLLKSMAKGEYICYIDDDDMIQEDYIRSILEAIESGKKVITFLGTKNHDGKQDLPFKYDVDYSRNYRKKIDGKEWRVMIPDHLCVWRKDAITEDFPNKNLAEDHDWAKQMMFTYTSEDQHHIDKYLYHYEYDRNTSECRR